MFTFVFITHSDAPASCETNSCVHPEFMITTQCDDHLIEAPLEESCKDTTDSPIPYPQSYAALDRSQNDSAALPMPFPQLHAATDGSHRDITGLPTPSPQSLTASDESHTDSAASPMPSQLKKQTIYQSRWRDKASSNDLFARLKDGEQMKQIFFATLAYFKKYVTQARLPIHDKFKAANTFVEMFGDVAHNLEFQMYLVKEFQLENRQALLEFILYAHQEEPVWTPRRKMHSLEDRQRAYHFWKQNSCTSVFRSNNRNIIKIKKENVAEYTADITDPDVSEKDNKITAHRSVTTMTYRKLFDEFQRSYLQEKMSFASFIKCKPNSITTMSFHQPFHQFLNIHVPTRGEQSSTAFIDI